MKKLTIGAALAASVLLLAGCGESDPGGSSADGGEGGVTQEAIDLMNEGDVVSETDKSEVTVDAVDNNFKPEYIEIKKGTKVNFVNDGRNVHNVLPVAEDAFTEIPADDFDPGDEGAVTFDEVGEFPYYCSLHGTPTKGMIGGIRVVE